MDAIIGGIDWAKIIGTISSGGPVYWIVTGVLALAVIGFKIWWYFNKVKIAERQSEKKKEQDRARSDELNQNAGNDFQDAENRNNLDRDRVKKKFLRK